VTRPGCRHYKPVADLFVPTKPALRRDRCQAADARPGRKGSSRHDLPSSSGPWVAEHDDRIPGCGQNHARCGNTPGAGVARVPAIPVLKYSLIQNSGASALCPRARTEQNRASTAERQVPRSHDALKRGGHTWRERSASDLSRMTTMVITARRGRSSTRVTRAGATVVGLFQRCRPRKKHHCGDPFSQGTRTAASTSRSAPTSASSTSST
jgi:hypothetical protein